MKQKLHVKTLILAAAATLGLALTAAAQSATVAEPAPATPVGGLLGSGYTGAAYRYIDLTGTGPNHADGLKIDFNQPLNANFDLNAGYDWARSRDAGARYTQEDAEIGTTAYTRLEWGRPFALVAAGWRWEKNAGLTQDSFRYKLGVGTEFQVTRAFVLTPYVNFVRATGLNESEADVGVKAAYRVAKDWSVTAGVQYDAIRHARDATEYTIGAAYHF